MSFLSDKYLSALAVAMVGLLVMAMACSDADEVNSQNPDTWNFDEELLDPEIDGPDEISFEPVELGESTETTFSITNRGERRLQILDIAAESSVEVIAPIFDDDEPNFVAAGDAIDITVAFASPEGGQFDGELIIESSDPESPEFSVDWAAEVLTRCVELSPVDSFEFGEIVIDEVARRTIRVTNCSTELDLAVQAQELSGDPAFNLVDDVGDEPLDLSAGEILEVDVEFAPTEPGFHLAELHFSTDDPDHPQPTVELTATAIAADDCAIPIIEASADDDLVSTEEISTLNAAPLDTVLLDGAMSSDAQGEPADQLMWTLVDAPEDSGAILESDADAAQNELFLDLAGTYVVELDVADAEGEWSCHPARLTILALVGSDIHVQLVWDTPGDPHRHNDHGSDMDLHFLHPDGQWGQAPYDCSWQNPQPTWSDSETLGNPTLDIDENQGWGPENINLDNPDEHLTYSVGVSYFTDRGYGASFATIRLYLQGELAEELTSHALHVGDFWYAMRVDGGLHEVDIVDEYYVDLPE